MTHPLTFHMILLVILLISAATLMTVLTNNHCTHVAMFSDLLLFCQYFKNNKWNVQPKVPLTLLWLASWCPNPAKCLCLANTSNRRRPLGAAVGSSGWDTWKEEGRGGKCQFKALETKYYKDGCSHVSSSLIVIISVTCSTSLARVCETFVCSSSCCKVIKDMKCNVPIPPHVHDHVKV